MLAYNYRACSRYRVNKLLFNGLVNIIYFLFEQVRNKLLINAFAVKN
jgi:hypothetical protein